MIRKITKSLAFELVKELNRKYKLRKRISHKYAESLLSFLFPKENKIYYINPQGIIDVLTKEDLKKVDLDQIYKLLHNIK